MEWQTECITTENNIALNKKDIKSPVIDFDHTSFNLLMQRRIRQVLLICSNYDAFMLEEDGRIDEQIFNEYVSLNLRYPPTFIQAGSSVEAFEMLEEKQVDLVISMLHIQDMDAFSLAGQIKERYPDIPIVTLTHFNREVSLRLQREDLSAIDYVFCWLGNANLLLAIIKLIEDRMNAPHDIQEIGVQAILLVEDSIRYSSSYLPNLYQIILKQSRDFAQEALNEHQRTLRMRGRPKILLATTYSEAVSLYEEYKHNLLGIISDVTIHRDKQSEDKEKLGLRFCREVREQDAFLPFIIQSSDLTNREAATELNAGFIHKYSQNLIGELTDYIVKNFAFGDFVFMDPDGGGEVARAVDLMSLQDLIRKVPDKVLENHARKNDFSKWLNARALFTIAQLFKELRNDDFADTTGIRKFLYEAIANYRISKGRGVIASFDKEKFNKYLVFSRIGEGSIGGKARGLAFINSIIEKHRIFSRYPGVAVMIPRTVVLGTDVFDDFMNENDLYEVALSDRTDREILDRFVAAKLPAGIVADLLALVEVLDRPIAVRSSSKLEDSQYQPFAGIYSTYMVPFTADSDRMTEMLSQAIKCVYASVYFTGSKAYMAATANVIDEEKMGIILQEVCGKPYNGRFYPALSGVARSINYYPIEPEKPADGIANISYGLGKYIMEGGTGLRFSPKYPKKVLQLSSNEMILKDTQKTFYALDMAPESFSPSVDDGINLQKAEIREAAGDPPFRFAASLFDLQNSMIRDGLYGEGKPVITFSNILNHKAFPLAEILSDLLQISQKEMNSPIEIEFAADLDVAGGEPMVFNFLQIRPIVHNDQGIEFDLDTIDEQRAIIVSGAALGNGVFEGIRDVVYVRTRAFDPGRTKEIAAEVGRINEGFVKRGESYVLVGPGRWGSTDPWLGVPVKWAQISAARIIVEAGMENFRIDPSQGTHFFQNVTSFGVGYMTVNPHTGDGRYDTEFLDSMKSVSESELVRHVRFGETMEILIDGRKNKGVVYKP